MIIKIRSPMAGLFVRELNINEESECKIGSLIAKLIVLKPDMPYRVIRSPVNGKIVALHSDHTDVKKGEIIAIIEIMPV